MRVTAAGQFVGLKQGVGRTFHSAHVSQRAQETAHEGRLSRAEVTVQEHQLRRQAGTREARAERQSGIFVLEKYATPHNAPSL